MGNVGLLGAGKILNIKNVAFTFLVLGFWGRAWNHPKQDTYASYISHFTGFCGLENTKNEKCSTLFCFKRGFRGGLRGSGR